MKSFEEYQKTDHNACSLSYKAGYYDAKEEMSYDVHTCHNDCTRLMCVQRREIERLKSKLAIATEALEEYSRGCAIRIKSEKWHLYDQDYATYSPQWYQRSMSDYDDRIVAREALNNINNLQI